MEYVDAALAATEELRDFGSSWRFALEMYWLPQCFSFLPHVNAYGSLRLKLTDSEKGALASCGNAMWCRVTLDAVQAVLQANLRSAYLDALRTGGALTWEDVFYIAAVSPAKSAYPEAFRRALATFHVSEFVTKDVQEVDLATHGWLLGKLHGDTGHELRKPQWYP